MRVLGTRVHLCPVESVKTRNSRGIARIILEMPRHHCKLAA